MRSNYKKLGRYIRQVDVRNVEDKKDNLLGVSTQKVFIESIANTVGTNFKKYKIVKKQQFTYVSDTSRRGDKIGIALLESHNEALVSQAYTVFEIIDTNELLPEYLMMWFRRTEFDRYTRFMSHGSVREIFGWEEMCDVELSVPSIEKQREIVKEYHAVVNRIKLNEELNQKFEETAQAIYKQWFVDFEFPIFAEYAASIGKPELEGKPYKSSGGEMVYNEELNQEIPKGWKLSKIESLVRYNYASYNKKTDKFKTLEYLDTGSITNNRMAEVQKLTVGVNPIPNRAKRKVQHNDIVYSTVRPNLRHFGLLKNPSSNMVVSTGFMVIQSIGNQIPNELILMWLTTDEIIEYLHSKAEMSVSTYPSIKPEDILDIKIILPEKKQIPKFEKLLRPLFNLLLENHKETHCLNNLAIVLHQKLASIHERLI